MQISGIQTDVTLADRIGNLARMKVAIEEEVAAGSQLVVFPECYISGYCFDSLEEAMQCAETIDGESVQAASEFCKANDCDTVF